MEKSWIPYLRPIIEGSMVLEYILLLRIVEKSGERIFGKVAIKTLKTKQSKTRNQGYREAHSYTQ